MKFNPRFYGIRNSEELKTIEAGLERLSKILDTEYNFSDGMNIDVWNTEVGSEIYPTVKIDNWIVSQEDSESSERDTTPINSYTPKEGKWIRMTIGDKPGRLVSFDFHYEPIYPERFDHLNQMIRTERDK